ncbi:Ribosomal protein S18 acetylase RimI [Lachnospiraceae bacterium G11]|nr:Ribosomal protein S18 acetylase RimI [Lachnospiraceae bacterium G11]
MEIIYLETIPDVDIYHDLRTSVGWATFSKEQSKKALMNSCHCVIAKDGNQTIAIGRAVGDGMYYTIVDVIVRPQYQGRKVGTEIINRLVDLINRDTVAGGRTSIQLIAAPGKEGFYVKQGFKVLPNENAGAALRKVIYT